MKKAILIFSLLLISQLCFSQEKLDAYKFADFDSNGRGCENYFRYQDFVQVLKKEEANGTVVIYTNEKMERFGNILGYLHGAKIGIERFLQFPKDRISIVVLQGEKFFAQEFWVIPKGAKPPYEESFAFDWSNISGRYHFSTACFACEPSYPMFEENQPAFNEYAQILKQFPSYKGEVVVNNFYELNQIKNELTVRNKLPRTRYSIKVRKQKKAEDETITVDLYLLAKVIK